jgi:D-sedoheptulose 7-phosphate isomerase
MSDPYESWTRHALASDRVADAMSARLDMIPEVADALHVLNVAARRHLPILACGHGGSMAQASAFAAELVGRHARHRAPVNARALGVDSTVASSVVHDFGAGQVFSREVLAYGAEGGALLVLDPGGKSKAVLNAVHAAEVCRVRVVAVMGKAAPPEWEERAEVVVRVPAMEPALVRQGTQTVLHWWAAQIEEGLGV